MNAETEVKFQLEWPMLNTARQVAADCLDIWQAEHERIQKRIRDAETRFNVYVLDYAMELTKLQVGMEEVDRITWEIKQRYVSRMTVSRDTVYRIYLKRSNMNL